MDTLGSIQPVLAELAGPLARQADTLLDLREAAMTRRAPGRCVNCYFKLLAAETRGGGTPRLTSLRRWLETHIEVVAQDADERELERAPLTIEEGEPLEAFARRLINRYFEDRPCLAERIQLNFAYRQESRAV